MPSQQERDSQAYPQRKRLKYKKDCPWEVEERPMDPEIYAQLSPSMKAFVDGGPPRPLPSLEESEARRAADDRKYAPLVNIVGTIFLLVWLLQVYQFVTGIDHRGDGWFDIFIGTLFYGSVTATLGWAVLKSLIESSRQQSREDDPPSLPVSDTEQEQHEVSPQVSEKERIQAHKFQLEKEKHLRMLEEQREREEEEERERREEYIRQWEAEEDARLAGEEQARILEEQQEPIEDWMLQNDYEDPDSIHDPSVDYGPGDDITEEEESRGWDYSGH